MGEYQEAQVDEGLVATKYILGNKVVDGHDHVFYLRDDLPIAAVWQSTGVAQPHSHSIEEGPGDTVICVPADGHTHTTLAVEVAGDYTPRTLFTG